MEAWCIEHRVEACEAWENLSTLYNTTFLFLKKYIGAGDNCELTQHSHERRRAAHATTRGGPDHAARRTGGASGAPGGPSRYHKVLRVPFG